MVRALLDVLHSLVYSSVMNDTARSAAPDTGALAFGLLKVAEMIDQRLNSALEPQRLSLAKFGVLQTLVDSGSPLPLGVLSERLGCVKSNITQLVDRLEADDLVRRIADPQDRRTKLDAITEEGRRRHAQGRRALDGAQRELLAGVSQDERARLTELLLRLGAGDTG